MVSSRGSLIFPFTRYLTTDADDDSIPIRFDDHNWIKINILCLISKKLHIYSVFSINIQVISDLSH